jgi:hypothetical protein
LEVLFRNRYPGRIAPTPFANFSALTEDDYVLPVNPSSVTRTNQHSGEHVELASGYDIVITPARDLYSAGGWSARQAKRTGWEVEFPEALPDYFIRQLQEYQERGQNIAIYLPAALPQPHGGSNFKRDRDKLWPDGNGYWYTRSWPFVEDTLKLYDRSGTLIYQYGAVDTYGVTVDGSDGRVLFPTTLPDMAEIYAEYDLLIYGRIMELPITPVPWGRRAMYGTRLVIQQMPYPVATRLTRLHFTGTCPSAITVSALPPGVTASDGSAFGQTTPVLGGLATASSGLIWSQGQAVVGDGDSHKDLFGKWVSGGLPAQVLAAGTVLTYQLVYWVAGVLFRPGVFAYIWRPGVGPVAYLTGADASSNVLTMHSTDNTGHLSSIMVAMASLAATGQAITIEYGDRLVIELWAQFNLSGVGKTFQYTGDVVNADYTDLQILGDHTADSSWIKLSNPLRVYAS